MRDSKEKNILNPQKTNKNSPTTPPKQTNNKQQKNKQKDNQISKRSRTANWMIKGRLDLKMFEE